MALSIALAALVASSAAVQLSLPDGYRFPTEGDYVDDWAQFREHIPVPFHIAADLDGNGRSDDAWILLKSAGRGWGLFVFLSGHDGQRTVIEVDADDGDSPPQRMFVDVVEPGSHLTACGKGYWDCESDEPSFLHLEFPGMVFGTFESATSVFWWDAEIKRFQRTWMSD